MCSLFYNINKTNYLTFFTIRESHDYLIFKIISIHGDSTKI